MCYVTHLLQKVSLYVSNITEKLKQEQSHIPKDTIRNDQVEAQHGNERARVGSPTRYAVGERNISSLDVWLLASDVPRIVRLLAREPYGTRGPLIISDHRSLSAARRTGLQVEASVQL